MAWKPETPEMVAAQAYAKRFNKDQVVIIAVDLSASTLEAISYGRNGALCKEAKALANAAYRAVWCHKSGVSFNDPEPPNPEP